MVSTQLAEQILLVSSRHRDRDLFPQTQTYSVNLGKMDGVYGLDILDASVPRTQDSVSDRNNILSFRVGSHGAIQSVSIPPGTYTTEQALVNAIQTELTKIESVLQVSLEDHHIVFTHPTDEFHVFLNRPQSIHRVLGFDSYTAPFVTSSGNRLVPRGRLDPTGSDSEYIIVHTNTDGMQAFSRVQHPPGAGVYFLDSGRSTKWIAYPTRWFARPVSLNTLAIRLENPDGTLYDTGYRDNMFVVRVWKAVVTSGDETTPRERQS